MPNFVKFRRNIMLLLLFFPILGCAAFMNAQELPAIKKDCATCHSGDIRKGNALLTAPLPALCALCHPESKGPADHKIDLAPSTEVAELPLSEGKMTCITCHDPHSNRYGKMLRVPAKDLCLLCHRY